jgi:hypothetical protein
MSSAYMIGKDEGIWFNEEDPTDINYKPECCTNVFVDCAAGKFDIIDTSTYYLNKQSDDEYEKYLAYLDYLEEICIDS